MKNCLNPKTIRRNKKIIQVRCRKCDPCRELTQKQWVSRMLYETAFSKYKPLFITPTYQEEPQNVDQVKKDIQRFIKRLRENGVGDLRYFVTVERGTKKGRLHCHAVLWSDISKQSYKDARMCLDEAWKKGFVLFKYMYGGRRGFAYASKYLLKNPLWYTYSKPSLGNIGKRNFIERAVNRYIKTGRIINRMRIPVLGEMLIVRVHSGWYRELIKTLGIRRQGEHLIIKEPKSDAQKYIDNMKNLLSLPNKERSDK
jgi:hypothetical protein